MQKTRRNVPELNQVSASVCWCVVTSTWSVTYPTLSRHPVSTCHKVETNCLSARYLRWVSAVIIVVANQFVVKAMSHIHASAQHLAGRMQVFTGDPPAFLISLSERQVGKLARTKWLPNERGSLPCSWKQTFHILLCKCWALARNDLYFLLNVQKHFSLGVLGDLVPAIQVSCVCSGV